MKVRHQPPPPADQRGSRDPKWATALILAGLAIATLVITRSAQDVPVVVGVVLVALGAKAPHP